MLILYIILAIVVLFVIFLWLSYNKLVRLSYRAEEAWSDIDVQLKRRYDLIPNLVNTVKGYAAHEKETFEKITEARNMAMQAGGPEAKGQAENMLSGALKSLFAVAEAYPDLKANTNFLQLQNELSDTENKVQSSRRFYNTMVMELNTLIDSFPQNIVARIFSFIKKEFFELENEAAREPVAVSF